MPKDDYASAIGGGLKLKGSKPEGVKKKKKKDKSKISSDLASTSTKDPEASKDLEGKETKVSEDVDAEELGRLEEEAYGGSGGGKTEAEKKYDEMKRKRLDERLQKQGAKTHKQRVEELNKYLSNLSEHHDMPRIGPG